MFEKRESGSKPWISNAGVDSSSSRVKFRFTTVGSSWEMIELKREWLHFRTFLPSEKGHPAPIFWMKFSGVIPSRIGMRRIAGMMNSNLCLRNIESPNQFNLPILASYLTFFKINYHGRFLNGNYANKPMLCQVKIERKINLRFCPAWGLCRNRGKKLNHLSWILMSLSKPEKVFSDQDSSQNQNQHPEKGKNRPHPWPMPKIVDSPAPKKVKRKESKPEIIKDPNYSNDENCSQSNTHKLFHFPKLLSSNPFL